MLHLALIMLAESPLTSFPPCKNAAPKCKTWERDWGEIDGNQFSPVISNSDQTWSIQTRALANKSSRSRPRAWVKVDYSSGNSDGARQVLTLYAFDCPEQRFAVLNRTVRDTKGGLIQNEDFREDESAFAYIVPETYVAQIAAFFCPA